MRPTKVAYVGEVGWLASSFFSELSSHSRFKAGITLIQFTVTSPRSPYDQEVDIDHV